MTTHTPEPWAGKQIGITSTGIKNAGSTVFYAGKERPNQEEFEANNRLILAAPALLRELIFVLDTEEQSCFEGWIHNSEPSGDCDSVHAQWLESSAYEEFCELWRGPIDAINLAK